MADDLEGMWNKLTLAKDEDDDDDAYVDDCISENSLSLVGKLLLHKPYNLDAMKVAVQKLGSSHMKLTSKRSLNLFLFFALNLP